jgi:hypothetical protein
MQAEDALVDFVNPVIFEPLGSIEPGVYTGLRFDYSSLKKESYIYVNDLDAPPTYLGRIDPSVTFTVPGGVGTGHPWEHDIKSIWEYAPGYQHPEWLWDLKVSGNKYTINPYFLQPGQRGFSDFLNTKNLTFSADIDSYVYYSDTLKFIMPSVDEGYGYELSWGSAELGMPFDVYGAANVMVLPFEGVDIPDNAGAVKFTVYWDLEDIIERYEGPTTASSDDVYILAKNFWERFSLTAVIEYN